MNFEPMSGEDLEAFYLLCFPFVPRSTGKKKDLVPITEDVMKECIAMETKYSQHIEAISLDSSLQKKQSKEDNRLFINSLGEGCVWVCNVNRNLENGDYITTCEIPGHGMKQDDDLLHNYTVLS